MRILKFGEVLKYFDINDFAYGSAKELTNIYENHDITSNIFNGILYNVKNRVTLNADPDNISTTKDLNFIQVTLNKGIAQKSNLEKKLFFKCKINTDTVINNQYVLIVGEYNYVSWVLVEINNGKFEFYDNDSTNITTNVLVKTIDIPKNEWINFEIHARFSEEEGFFRYDIKVNNELIQNISGNKKTSDVYNDSCFDDGFVLYNVLNATATNNIIFKDISLQRQYYQFIKKPIITFERNENILTASVEVDPNLEFLENCNTDYTFEWEDGSTDLNKVIDIDEEYKIFKCFATDSLGQRSEAYYLVENFKEYVNKIVKYGWSTTGEMKKQITLDDKQYKMYNYIAQDMYGKLYYGSCFVENFENEEETYEITSYEWNTNEVTESIYVNVDETEYKEFYCTVTDNYGNKTTDSIIVNNFIEPYNEIKEYRWDNSSTEQIRTIQQNSEYGVYRCTVTDLWGNSATGYYVIENFKPLEKNRIVSYKWNTNEVTRSINVPYPVNEQYKPYYCTVTDKFGNKITESVIVTKFADPPETNTLTYSWGSTNSQSLTVSLDSFNTEYKIYTCAVTDSYGSKTEESYIVEKPITLFDSCRVDSYKWNTGETTQTIDVNLNSVENFEVFTCEVKDNFNRTTTDSIILTNFNQPFNNIDTYKWNTGETTQSITVDLNDIDDDRTYFCTSKDIYGRAVTDSIIVDNFKEITNEITDYKWNTGETTQSITVNLDDVNEAETYFCTVESSNGKSVTDSIIVDNFKEITNEITGYTWNNGETTQSITVDLNNVEEASTFFCTVEDEYGKAVTDSIIVDNFKEISNSIISYLWNNGETTESIVIDKDDIDEQDVFYCTVNDYYGRAVTDSIIVDNFKPIENSIMSYEWFNGETTSSITINKEYIVDYLSCWCTVTDSFGNTVTDNYVIKQLNDEVSNEMTYLWNTGETTQSITVPKPDDEFEVYYCTLETDYNQVTDSIIIDRFKDIRSEIVSYEWSNGETTQSINLDLEDYPTPDLITCTVTDDLGQTATGFEVLTNSEPNFTYEWSNGATSKIVSLRKNGVYTVTVTSEAGTSKSASVELEGLGDRPTVEITTIPASIEEGESLTLTALGTDLDGDIVKYRWYKVNPDNSRTLIDEYNDSTQSITIDNVKKDDVYIVQVEDDDGYIAESKLEVDFIEFTDVMFYKYNGKTFIIPLHAVITDNSISVYKNSRNLYARYVEVDDLQASHLHVKINDEIKKLKKL